MEVHLRLVLKDHLFGLPEDLCQGSQHEQLLARVTETASSHVVAKGFSHVNGVLKQENAGDVLRYLLCVA